MMKNKVFTFINIIGLSAGLVCCMLISFYILNETSYDKFHKGADDIYQVGTTFIQPDKELKLPNTPAPFAAAMKVEFPQVQMVTRMLRLFADDKTLIQYQDKSGTLKSFYETKGYLVDPSFFNMFTYNFIEGEPAKALANPRTVVLSEEIAKKLFGNESAVNKVVHISSSTNGDYDFLVTGVFKPTNKPSHLDGRFFMSMNGGAIENYIKENGNSFATNNMFYTYIKLKHGSDPRVIEKQFPSFVDKYAGNELKNAGFNKKQFLVALKDIHLRSGMPEDVTPSGSMTYLYILASIALFTLLIACINFMNLSTARSTKRSAEVGIRKVLGAERKSLIRQFLGESVLMSLLSFAFAIVITYFLIPAFNNISDKHLAFSDSILVLAGFFVLSFITGLVAGIYPAFYLSSFLPVKVLKGKFSNSFAVASLRKGLVVFQFVISVVLIVAAVVIAGQMKYMRSTDLGFAKDHQIIIPLATENAKEISASLQKELASMPMVINSGASLYNPGTFNPSDRLFYKEGATMNDASRVRLNFVDYNYLKTLEITPVAGHLFSRDFPSDTLHSIILNETAIKQAGFSSPEGSIGKMVYSDLGGNHRGWKIVGVVKDFHFEDLRLPITPYGYQLMNEPEFNYLTVHVKPGDMSKVLKNIQSAWHSLDPNEPFDYSFLDSDFQKNYKAEIRLSVIVNYFTIIAILISCLGLFGLATFSAEQRIKEIGVRKVLGASVSGIVALLSKDFLKLVVISIIIAIPIAWYIMNKWLQEFAYRISIDWTTFAITALIAMFIAFITISFQAIKAAVANPVDSLRSE